MSLTVRLAAQVDSVTRARGAACYRMRQVRILSGDEEAVDAIVTGSLPYGVALRRTRQGLASWCTCPFVERNSEVCKHIWSALVAAEASGHLDGDTPFPPRLLLDSDLHEEAFPLIFDLDGDEDDQGEEVPETRPAPTRQRPGHVAKDWRGITERFWRPHRVASVVARDRQQPPHRPLYAVDPQASREQEALVIRLGRSGPRDAQSGTRFRSLRLPQDRIGAAEDPADREVFALLGGARPAEAWLHAPTYSYERYFPDEWALTPPLAMRLLPAIAATGRLVALLDGPSGETTPLVWDGGEPWRFVLSLAEEESGNVYNLGGSFRRNGATLAISAPQLVIAGGVIMAGGSIGPFDDGGAFEWIGFLRRSGSVFIPVSDGEEILGKLLSSPAMLPLDLPEALRCEEVSAQPRPLLRVTPVTRHFRHEQERLQAELYFDYEGTESHAGMTGAAIPDLARRRIVRRDAAAEREAGARLLGMRLRPMPGSLNGPALFHIAANRFAQAVSTLMTEGWRVEASGRLYRPATSMSLHVASGVDWFDLTGNATFDDQSVSLPRLLAALRKGEGFIVLGDGSLGLLPEEWVRRYGRLGELSDPGEDGLRFSLHQASLLDALLAAEPAASCDEAFVRLRERLASFAGISAVNEPAGFTGELRGYQREGLGWFRFLEEFGFGGCLADDMGLGKTVQVLALFESRRLQNIEEKRGPSLVVAPRSLVFNWMEEAARFTPALRLRDHTGTMRRCDEDSFSECDVVLTTYGTLRRDAAALCQMRFDYVVLDEAQSIKNAKTQAAKAARLLKAGHRLALSGTPIENHIGELWSLFEFLNPGMLGTAPVFSRLAGAGGRGRTTESDEAGRGLLARAVRPFILRRTKQQVARELPERIETTLTCELDTEERRHYDELRSHYRQSLASKIASAGLQRSKIHVLEALLRLRQAACHPGLIDPSRADESSTKLEILEARLDELLDEGHKALVFSQFTSLLAIVRRRLDARKIPYAYLDGRTRDRAAQVKRFQSDPKCPLFLISLKAGGLGLNLTAAEYVFLLDPWWNPAVEAQAIDRAHRIGQTQRVVACRLVARDTVEEKILLLQKSKRDLADAIIQADSGLVSGMTREDLELLLS